MEDDVDLTKLEFRYHRLPAKQRDEILKKMRRMLEEIGDILFAYVHGGFVERGFFRDIDVAVWLKDPDKAFYYTVNYSVKAEAELRLPIDIQVLNEAPLPFKYHVFTYGKLLFSKDEKLRCSIIDVTIRQYLDLKQFERMEESRIGRLTERAKPRKRSGMQS